MTSRSYTTSDAVNPFMQCSCSIRWTLDGFSHLTLRRSIDPVNREKFLLFGHLIYYVISLQETNSIYKGFSHKNFSLHFQGMTKPCRCHNCQYQVGAAWRLFVQSSSCGQENCEAHHILKAILDIQHSTAEACTYSG